MLEKRKEVWFGREGFGIILIIEDGDDKSKEKKETEKKIFLTVV